jgi:hypothetical protein
MLPKIKDFKLLFDKCGCKVKPKCFRLGEGIWFASKMSGGKTVVIHHRQYNENMNSKLFWLYLSGQTYITCNSDAEHELIMDRPDNNAKRKDMIIERLALEHGTPTRSAFPRMKPDRQ